MNCKISVEPQGEVYRNIHIAIPHEEYSKRFDVALGKTAAKVRLKGFRPGRAPKAMVAKLYGTEIHQEVMETLASSALRTAMKEHELEIIGRPQVSFKDVEPQKDVEITANVAIAPRPKIEHFEKLAFDVPTRKVTDADYERELESLRERQAKYHKVEGRDDARTGDYVVVSYEATVEGEPLPGTKPEKRFIRLGSDMLMKELDEAIVGMKRGEEKVVQVPLSEKYTDASVAGKMADYKVSLIEIEDKELPEINDELAKASGLAETAAELPAALRAALEKAFDEQNTQQRERKLFETLIEKNPFEVPQVMVDEEIRSILFEMNALDRRRRDHYEMDMTPFRKPLEAQASYRVKSIILLDQLLETSNIEPTEEELESWLNELVSKGGFKSRDELNRQLGLPEAMPRLKTIYLREKTTERLLAEAKITETEWTDEKHGAAEVAE